MVYGYITRFRNYLYDKKVFKSVRFEIPTITIGNLVVGGSGKTPHVEYLIKQLQPFYRVGTLSRGYARKTSGFQLADFSSNALQMGDEPMIFKYKYPQTAVSVSEDRVIGIPKLLDVAPEVEVVILDDSYQHRAIRAGISVLLTEFNNLYVEDEMLPLGWLREQPENAKRADFIIVTKSPDLVSEEKRNEIIAKLKPEKYQRVFFSKIKMGNIYPLFHIANEFNFDSLLNKETTVLLVTGIAKNEALISYLKTKFEAVYTQAYKNHHYFDQYDLEMIRGAFNSMDFKQKIIITTEKDAVRFLLHRDWFLENKIEVFVQPIEVEFLDQDGILFINHIQNYIEKSLVAQE